ncbi:MAG TPA: M1 family metallopeptidase [Gemmatimonadales bacterium]|nr:M1 family metallopeptidase [Gemmatimonadales bacterium]
MLGLLLLLQAAGPSPLAQRFDPDSLRPRHRPLHYDVQIAIGDTGAHLVAQVQSTWLLASGNPLEIQLDTAFRVVRVLLEGREATRLARTQFAIQESGVYIPHEKRAGDTLRAAVRYHGSPRGGLVFTADPVHGPTVFADNWPDRAHRWLPLADHPSAKVTADFHVEVPAGMQVVATGRLVRVDTLVRGRTAWHFRQAQPVPPYGLVIGVGRFAWTPLADAACDVKCVPGAIVTAPHDSAWAVDGPFRRAAEIVSWMSRLVGPFPYDQLLHVQAATRFGGMENPTAIFYASELYDTRSLDEGTVAHEIAHQWFGDAVTEDDWRHLWLSEGFATYLAALWAEHTEGVAGRRAALARGAERVFESPATSRPILDRGSDDLLELLNTNNYPKGAWVLHSLRGLLGDSVFFQGLREYYQAFRHRTALSSDFAEVMSRVSGVDLEWYFRQALTQPGYPRLDLVWKREGRRLRLRIRQVQPADWGTYRLPGLVLEVDGRRIRAEVNGPETVVTVPEVRRDPERIVVDPDGWWLLQASVSRER